MTANEFGDNFRITTFGESHGRALGVVIDGVHAGMPVDLAELQAELDRRRPGQPLTSPRGEPDQIEVLSGIFEGTTTGAPIALLIRNKDARPGDYEVLRETFRPGHADYTWWKKYGIRDWRGGGRSSGRETVARVAAGGIARQLLAGRGVRIIGHVVRIGPAVARRFDPAEIERNPLRCADIEAAVTMARLLEQARQQGDSWGGTVEVIAEGVPAGWGDPVFQKLDAMLGAALLSIGAVKGVEIGDGFALASARGSASNDPLVVDGQGQVAFARNRHGGILGGISNGAPIVVRAAIKPTPSIRRAQPTIDASGQPRMLSVGGRHDPCICPRVVPVVEAMVALVLADACLAQQARSNTPIDKLQLAAELAFCDAEIARFARRREALVAAGDASGLGPDVLADHDTLKLDPSI